MTLNDLQNEIKSVKDVLSSFLKEVRLNSTKTWATAICPFHEDTNPSFSINCSSGAWVCHGCQKRGAFTDIPSAPKHPVPIATYPYLQDGHIKYVKVKFFPKTFRIASALNGSGKFTWGLGNTSSLLYNWDNVKIKNGPIYIVEGEKDVDTLTAKGFLSVTAGGATSWDESFNELIKDREIYLIPDNDVAGRAWTQKLEKFLPNLGGILQIKDPSVKDITDWIDCGNSLKDIPVYTKYTQIFPEIEKVELLRAKEVKVFEMATLKEPVLEKPLWGPFVPKNLITLIYADGGVGKSLFSLCFASYAALKQPFLGYPILTECRTLFVDYELNLDLHTVRSYQICRGLNIEVPPKGLFYFKPTHNLEDSFLTLKQLILDNQINLLIVDSLGAGSGVDTTKALDINFVFSKLLDLGVTVLLIDHEAKQNIKSPLGNLKPYGSVYKYNLARSVLRLTQEIDGYTLYQFKNNFGKLAVPLNFDFVFDESSVKCVLRQGPSE